MDRVISGERVVLRPVAPRDLPAIRRLGRTPTSIDGFPQPGDPADQPGGLAPQGPQPETPARAVWLLQRRPGRPGKGLGKTTGWIHRAALEHRGVHMWGGIGYGALSAEGFAIARDGQETLLPVDDVVICAGQEPERSLADALTRQGQAVHVIGGASVAAELDAKRAIDEGARLAARL